MFPFAFCSALYFRIYSLFFANASAVRCAFVFFPSGFAASFAVFNDFNSFLALYALIASVNVCFDFSFLILRTDLAFPIRKPYLPERQRLVLNQINFGNSSWRKENLVLNLAIGYPF